MSANLTQPDPHADNAMTTARLSVTDLAAIPIDYSLIKPSLLGPGTAIRDWLLGEARMEGAQRDALTGVCERLVAAGVPLDRASLVIETLHSQHAAISKVWRRGEEPRREAHPYVDDSRSSYRRSPFFHVHQTRDMLSLWLPDTPDERFGVVPSLKADGYVHYLCFPIFFANGDENGIAFATKSPAGFSQDDIDLLNFVMPALSAATEIIAGYLRLDTLLRTYVGDEPHKEILSGVVRRGQVTRIRSAILFADMRSYTQRTSVMEPEAVAELLNAYFDCLVPAIEDEGGEILKYMGDGLLAIFRDKGDDTGGAADAALRSARVGLACIEAYNAENPHEPIKAGIALHHGEAAYGNVGSGVRLDFTVVGRDVNIASRLARLNKVIDEPLLMSGAFADHLWADGQLLGSFALDGINEAVRVYRP